METTARYDSVADFYEAQSSDSYSAGPDAMMLELVGEVAGQQVLDIACGQGRITRELARRGAEVTGVDISAALLDRARGAEAHDPLGITYIEADVASPHTLHGDRFDTAVCHFGLSDIDDLNGAVATIARVLRPGGAFVFTILHPCFPGWGTDVAASWPPAGGGYYEEGWWAPTDARSTLRKKVGANHRMLSTYFNALTRSGLAIEEIAEPPPPDEWTTTAPTRGPTPVFLVARTRRL